MATKKNKIHNNWNPPTVKVHENTGEIHTKPNQAQTIRDILFRNTQGMSYDNYKTPYYEEQSTFSSIALNKIQDLEPVEKLQYLSEVGNQVKDLKSKITKHEAEKAKAIEAQKAPPVQTQQEPPKEVE
jgi:hypothetical protein